MSPVSPLYVSRFSAWAPGLDRLELWQEWAADNREIPGAGEGPALEFTDPLFRRRLSLVSRMTIQVLHDLLLPGEDPKILFFSFRGEITQQLRINQGLIEEHTVRPAVFSLSVFNTPVALATIALNLRAGYTAIYPGEGRFTTGLWAAAAPVSAGDTERMVLVYADESAPEEYGPLRPRENGSLALGAILSSRNSEGALPLEAADGTSPENFLRSLLQREAPYGSP
ncbi:beta-ketoacyl synthase chain length factor [Treponema sp. TIM-1]|uniref:beta-ketoacyl synthase chain length factor n=1 Tax=Treponema sp. TIM-1 TaxID=2898417 RepID=UPI003980F9B0